MSLRGKLEVAGLTDTGMVREHNEDYIGLKPEHGLVVLADGMGGLKAGEVASAMAVEVITDELMKVMPTLGAGREEDRTGYTRESLAVGRSIVKANEAIYQVAQTQPQCAGMGTTLVMALFYDNRLTVAHVGDSRMYRLRHGEFEQVTADHSLIQELIERGFYTREEARKSANKNIVTRALGIAPTVDYDLQEEVALRGDIFLLCSDGLNDMLEDDQIGGILVKHQDDLQHACQKLVDAANDNGGADNVSVLLVRVLKPFPAKNGLFGRLTSLFE